MVEETSEIVDPIKHLPRLRQLVILTRLVSDIQPIEILIQVLNLLLKMGFILGA